MSANKKSIFVWSPFISKVGTVQNVINRSKDSRVEKEKRKLQDLVIEFEKLPCRKCLSNE